MCAIVGGLVAGGDRADNLIANNFLNRVFDLSMERGRDGLGWSSFRTLKKQSRVYQASYRNVRNIGKSPFEFGFFGAPFIEESVIGNLRAEPTTEYVAQKKQSDQQPYEIGPWAIVHNGTIANDAQLRSGELATHIDSAAIVELLARDHMLGRSVAEVGAYFASQIALLKGSYAILAVHREHPGKMMVACNYRPIWVCEEDYGLFFASSRHYFPAGSKPPQMLEPYSAWLYSAAGVVCRLTLPPQAPKRVLVVCSGGLDSVVAARAAQHAGMEITLCHFQYGSRAEGPEVKAVQAVAEELGVPLRFIPMGIYDPEDSPLLQSDSTVAAGEAGAEFAHEWVPARNLVMLALATAHAEAKGYDAIVLGNNLEEAGAYPDNEPEFIARFNDMLPFAVADGKRVQVLMPVGNLMKHEIVALGYRLNAPMDKTWSCYGSGRLHCGSCGPCFMRRTAFEINNLPEVIEYEPVFKEVIESV